MDIFKFIYQEGLKCFEYYVHNEMKSHEYIDNNLFNTVNQHHILCGRIEKYTKARELLNIGELKKDKRIFVQNNKTKMFLRKSTKHIEVDMSLLGCNAKSLWNDVFTSILQVYDINKMPMFIVCVNFESIHPELLDIFYSYMQKAAFKGVYYILLTTQLSFIPISILNICHITSFREKAASITYNIDNRLFGFVTGETKLTIFEVRDLLYTNMIYNNDLDELIIVIYNYVLNKFPNKSIELSTLLTDFYKQYYNNYRSIYHLELILLQLSRFVKKNGSDEKTSM